MFSIVYKTFFMFLKKIIKQTNKINFNSNIIYPIFKRKNIIQIYWYRFLKNRLELITTKGTIVNFKKRKNLFEITTITIKQKLYGITVYTKFQLNNISLIGIRVIQNC